MAARNGIPHTRPTTAVTQAHNVYTVNMKKEADVNKVLWHITMSLDGFIAGPGDDMSWIRGHASAMPEMAQRVLEGVGAILGGRTWYDGALAHHSGLDGIYGGAYDGPVIVLTHRPEPTESRVQFATTGFAAALRTAKAAAGADDVVIFGADTARQAVMAGTLDEVVLHIAPVLLGEGTRLVDALPERVNLELTEMAQSGQLVDLRYRISAKSADDAYAPLG